MIKEFAVEPEVMATWAHFQSLFEDFGVGRGRLISRYPKNWAQEVERLAHQISPPVRASAIAAKVFAHKQKFIPARRDYDSNKSWLVNAEKQMTVRPFHAVIAQQNPRGHRAVRVAEEFDKGDAPYHVETQQSVPRTAEALAQCAKLLLSVCEELQLVDPHFDPAEPRFAKTLQAMLSIRSSAPQRLKVLEIHTEKKWTFNRQNREDHLCRAFQNVIPSGTTLRVHFWQQRPGGEKLHPRFLLTEMGGLQYDYGLDEGDSQHEPTVVTLMDHGLWQKVRADYHSPSPIFDITDDCIINVQGRA